MTYLELNKCLTFDESSIKEQIHRFGVEVIRPAAMELDPLPPEKVIAPGSVFWEVFRKAYQLGLHSSGLSAAVGGVEMSPLARHIYSEEMGWASADFAIGLGVSPFPYSFAAMTGIRLCSKTSFARSSRIRRRGSSAAGRSPSLPTDRTHF